MSLPQKPWLYLLLTTIMALGVVAFFLISSGGHSGMQKLFDNRYAYDAFWEGCGSRLAEAGASRDFVYVAAKIWAHQPLSAGELAQLGPEIDAVYNIGISPSGSRKRDQPLLAIAAERDNPDAWEVLLAAGARPDVSTIIPYDMVSVRSFVNLRVDWSASVAMTRAYIAHGGDPNLQVNGAEPPLSYALSNGNLEAALILLDAGAEPWREIHAHFTNGQNGLDRYIPVRNADYFGSGPAFIAELARRGYFAEAPTEAVVFLVDRYIASIEEDLSSPSTTAMESLQSGTEVLGAFLDAKIAYRREEMQTLSTRGQRMLGGEADGGNKRL